MHATQLCMWLFDLHMVVNLSKLTIINIAGVWGMPKEVMLCVTVDAEGDRQLIASDPQEICVGGEYREEVPYRSALDNRVVS